MGYRINYLLNDKKKELLINNSDINFNIVKTVDSDTPKFTFSEQTTDAVKYSDLDKVWDALKTKEAFNINIMLVEDATKQEFLLYSLDKLTNVRYNFQLNRNTLEEAVGGIPIAKILTIQ